MSPRRWPVLLVAVLATSGCAFPWQETEEDRLARGPPEPLSYSFEHDFLGNGRSLPFKMNTSTGTLTLRLEVRQVEGVAACMEDRTPPRIRVSRPGDELALELVAPILPGSPDASADGSGRCSAVMEETLDRTRGVWRIQFTGSGNFTGHATITG